MSLVTVPIPADTLKFYHWEDIEQFICSELGISVEDVRGYAHTNGQTYDLWDIWLQSNYVDTGILGSIQLTELDSVIMCINGWLSKDYEGIEFLSGVIENLKNNVEEHTIWIMYPN